MIFISKDHPVPTFSTALGFLAPSLFTSRNTGTFFTTTVFEEK